MSPAFFDALSMALRLQNNSSEKTELTCVEHGCVPSRDFTSVSFYESGIDGVRKSKFSEVFSDIVFHLVCLETSCKDTSTSSDKAIHKANLRDSFNEVSFCTSNIAGSYEILDTNLL